MTKYRQAEIREALLANGGTSGRKGTADVLSAIAMCESRSEPGWADADRWGDGTLTVFRIMPGSNPLRNPDFLSDSLENACLAALALANMGGFKQWESFRTLEYRTYLPELWEPETLPGEPPYKLIRVLPHYSIFELLKLCGWIAPSLRDALNVLRQNGLHASDWPVDSFLKVPNQRGW